MDQYIGTPKRATYLHPGPSGPFLELNNEPLKPPSPVTAALLQHNPSLLDICVFNSLCQRLVENTSPTSSPSYKPIVTPSDVPYTVSPISPPEYSQPISKPEPTTSPISSAGDCSPNVSSCTSTPYSSPKIKHLFQQNSPLDLSATILPRESISNERSPLITDTKLPFNNFSYASPILHRLLTSPTAKPTSSNNSISEPLENENNKSPQYQPRYSPYYSPETQPCTKIVSQ